VFVACERERNSLVEGQNLYHLSSPHRLLALVDWCKYFVTIGAANLKAELRIKYRVEFSSRCSRCDCSGGHRSAGIVAEIQLYFYRAPLVGMGVGSMKNELGASRKLVWVPAEADREGCFSSLRIMR
jgi:hypothetical protein